MNSPEPTYPVRLTTRAMWFYKTLLPVVIGLLPLALIIIAAVGAARGEMTGREATAVICIALLSALIAGTLWFGIVRPLTDEVIDHGDHWEVLHGGATFRFPVTTIARAESSVVLNPPVITLTLRQPVAGQAEIRFVPRFSWLAPFQPHPLAAELNERLNARRPDRPV